MSDLEGFREEVRTFLERECPPSMRQPVDIMASANWGGRRGEFFEPVDEGLPVRLACLIGGVKLTGQFDELRNDPNVSRPP